MSPEKIVHFARYISPYGDISPWCAKKPRKIDLNVETWTNRIEAATCHPCKVRYEQSKAVVIRKAD
jgi:hypothetical protein